MIENKKERLLFWDILKGIGIISIVFGHSPNPGIQTRIVYFYHLVIFFFVSGYFYNEKRYGDKPFEFFAARLKNMWVPYVSYGLLFVILNNFFVTHYLFVAELNDGLGLFFSAFDVMLLNYNSGPAGALWFVPIMLGAGAIFSFIVWICRSFLPEKIRPWVIGGICIAVGMAGAYLNHEGVYLTYHLQTAVLVVPIYFVGYILKTCKIDMKKYVTWYGALGGIAVFWYAIRIANASVELSANIVPGNILFFIISLAGIYLCCFGAKIVERIPIASKLLGLIGTHSFDIMALHFAVFKIIDGIYGRLRSLPVRSYNNFPHSYPELRVVYIVLGVLMPLIFAVAAKRIIKEIGQRARTWSKS